MPGFDVKQAMHPIRSRAACRRFAGLIGQGPDCGLDVCDERFDACVSRGASGMANRVGSDEQVSRIEAKRRASYLRVSVPAIIAHSLIAPALPRFREQHEDVRVHLLIVDDSTELARCDAAIRTGPLAANGSSRGRQLAIIPEVLCASEEFLNVHGQPTTPSDLDAQQCIGIFAEGQQPRAWSFYQGETEVKIVPASALAFSEARGAVATAVRGGGIILVPALAAEAEIAAGLITPLLPDWSTPRHAVWLEQREHCAPGVEAFADFVAGLLPD